VGTSYDVVLGWHWYSVYGEYTDHDYGTRGALDTIIEIQSDYGVDEQLAIHVPRAIALLALARDGLAGRVTDAVTGASLSASIWVAQRRAPVFTAPGLGDFHEVLVAGTYDVTVIAPHHRFVTLPGVDVPPVGSAWLDVSLEPSAESYGFAVAEVILPHEIGDSDYANTSVPSDALGPPDGEAFFLEPDGEIVIDLAFDVADHDGPELHVYAGPDGSTDGAEVRGAATSDGPWTLLGSIDGSADIDLAGSGLASLRFVRIIDTTGGRFGSLHAGYDLDAIEVLPLPAADADADADVVDDADADVPAEADAEAGADADVPAEADAEAGADADADAEADGAADAHADADGSSSDGGGESNAGGCGCRATGNGPSSHVLALFGIAIFGFALRRRSRAARSPA
jgi:MYXO-CTERM domain-containing protein